MSGVSVSIDTRTIQPGDTFIALKGNEKYVKDAISKGAKKIVVGKSKNSAKISAPKGVEIERVRNTYSYLIQSLKRTYKPKPKTIVAVTGTNGKSSVVSFTRQIWQYFGHKAASIGTVGIETDVKIRDSNLTTPDLISLHKTLAELGAQGITHVALEASSHGLHQQRLDGLKIKGAAFTNLTRDHLDYHKSMKDYFRAKFLLFSKVLSKKGVAVLNSDITEYDILSRISITRGIERISYGITTLSDIQLAILSNEKARICTPEGLHDINLSVFGDFQVLNMLCAAGLVVGTSNGQVSWKQVIDILPLLKSPTGRLEQVVKYNNAPIIVDYAHTPDALKNAIEALKIYTRGKVIVVFGCGGDRDPGKRPQMGQIAHRLADTVIVTDDNPRTEDPNKIREEIIKECPNAYNVSDRAIAIQFAIDQLSPGDILLVAGKGHEDYQIIGTEKIPFSDHEIIKEYVSKK